VDAATIVSGGVSDDKVSGCRSAVNTPVVVGNVVSVDLYDAVACSDAEFFRGATGDCLRHHDRVFVNVELDSDAFEFSDRFSGEEGYFSGKGRVVDSHRTWDSNFIADVPGFKLIDHSARGQGASGILLHFSSNTISAHIEEYPVGTYPRAHWHGPGAHIVILSGEGYSLLWEP
jgi:hypothetical protein